MGLWEVGGWVGEGLPLHIVPLRTGDARREVVHRDLGGGLRLAENHQLEFLLEEEGG